MVFHGVACAVCNGKSSDKMGISKDDHTENRLITKKYKNKSCCRKVCLIYNFNHVADLVI